MLFIGLLHLSSTGFTQQTVATLGHQEDLLLDMISRKLAIDDISNQEWLAALHGSLRHRFMGKKSQATRFASSRALPCHHLRQVWEKRLLSGQHR